MTKIGRNDPCYCGSGKKYKNCHMQADNDITREKRAWAEAGRFLRRDIIQFARQERFATAVAEALPFYWNNFYDAATASDMSMPEGVRFFDWFVYDYQPDGRRLLDLYAEENRDSLSHHQQITLDRWLTETVTGAYELTGYDGQTLHLRDFMTGETYDIFEAGGHGNVEIGEVIITRLVPVHDQLEMSVSAAYLPAAEIADLADKLAAAKAADAETYPDADHQEFMRRHNYILVHHALEHAAIQGRPPVARLNPDRDDLKTQKRVTKIKRRLQ
ncbi:MAG: SEC-C domain-containing protein [Chloroflexi bacterium]|nr:SEC-C domain-containing protein [Chloroflexota bacterium]